MDSCDVGVVRRGWREDGRVDRIEERWDRGADIFGSGGILVVCVIWCLMGESVVVRYFTIFELLTRMWS